LEINRLKFVEALIPAVSSSSSSSSKRWD